MGRALTHRTPAVVTRSLAGHEDTRGDEVGVGRQSLSIGSGDLRKRSGAGEPRCWRYGPRTYGADSCPSRSIDRRPVELRGATTASRTIAGITRDQRGTHGIVPMHQVPMHVRTGKQSPVHVSRLPPRSAGPRAGEYPTYLAAANAHRLAQADSAPTVPRSGPDGPAPTPTYETDAHSREEPGEHRGQTRPRGAAHGAGPHPRSTSPPARV